MVSRNIATTLKQRGGRYGDFTVQAQVEQDLKAVMQRAPNWNKLPAFIKSALEVIAQKISRCLCGDPFYDDNPHDIGGYAKLWEDRVNIKGTRR